jgi:hypothetical protein
LENASLRAVVVPELRGRIVSIIDKATNTEVVHHGDPGERLYPDVSGAAVYAVADYVQAKTYDTTWQLESSAAPLEVHLVGACPDGLKMRRTIRLLPDKPVVQTESTVENTGSAPLDAVLSARFEAAPKDLKSAAVVFRNQTGKSIRKPVFSPGEEPTGTAWYAGTDQPDGEWTVTGGGTQLAVVNRFAKEQTARTSVSWSGKADSRVTLNVWSAKRKLAPGETLKLEADYGILH